MFDFDRFDFQNLNSNEEIRFIFHFLHVGIFLEVLIFYDIVNEFGCKVLVI